MENKNPNIIIEYSDKDKMFFNTREQSNESYLNTHLRTNVTDAWYTLSGYQKGECYNYYKCRFYEKDRAKL
ncbi:MAG: hypothetical protein SCJ93_06170 [Bacillota bacterium]|nr:hypothetical protein [Bacillota bacterium]